MTKKTSETIDYSYDSANKIVATRWNDNIVVTRASNFQAVNPIWKAKQYSRKEKKIIEVDEPYAVWCYNQNTGGVDHIGQNISF